MSKETQVQVSLELSKSDGYASLYLRFGDGAVHRTIEITDEINADVDSQGALIGVEVIHSFDPMEGEVSLKSSFVLEKIQEAIERKMGTNLESEFSRFREAADAISLSGR